MIKRLLLSWVALAVLTACNSPARAEPSDLCDLIPADEVGRTFDELVTVTKRLVSSPESPWAYCLYGTPTQHFLTLGAPVTNIYGNIRVLPGPRIDPEIAAEFERSANDRAAASSSIDPIDIPAQCADLRLAAQALIGRITYARGTADEATLTCDFIGEHGSVSAESRPRAFAQTERPTGVTILEEPDVAAAGVKTANGLQITGFVDHRRLNIRIVPTGGYSAVQISGDEQRFAREFAEASWT